MAANPYLPVHPPLFLAGCPRSGTTVLASLLADTRWGAPFETHFIPKYARRLGTRLDLSDRSQFHSMVSSILRERPVMQHYRAKHIKLDIDQLYEQLPRHDFATVASAICFAVQAAQGYPSWSDKTPHYVLELELLHRLYPDSPIVVIVRDGRDVALSLLQKSWGPANIYACAQYWKNCCQTTPLLENLIAAGKAIRLRYEDLLQQPDKTASRLLEFLDEDPHSAHAQQWMSELRRNNHSKWRQQMSPKEIALFERVAGDQLRQYGYECGNEAGSVGLLTRAKYGLHSRCKLAWHLFRLNVVDTILIRFFGKRPFGE